MPSAKLWRRPRGRSGKLPILLIIGVALAAAGATFAVTQLTGRSDQAEGERHEGAEEELGTAETVDLGEFLVNVLDKNQMPRYVKADVSLVVQLVGAGAAAQGNGRGHGSRSEDNGGEQLPANEHRVARDVVIRLLSAERFANTAALTVSEIGTVLPVIVDISGFTSMITNPSGLM